MNDNPIVLVKRFIQNYYEVHGSFDRIELSILAEYVRDYANAAGMPIKDYCISCLGYKAGITEEDLEAFSRWQMRDLEWFKSLNLYDEDAINDYVKKRGCKQKRVWRENTRKDEKVLQASALLTDYYLNSTDVATVLDNTELSMRAFVNLLRMSVKNISAAKIIEGLKNNDMLVSFQKVDDGMYIQNKVFYYSGLTKRQVESVQRTALLDVINGKCLAAGVLNKIDAIPFISMNDNLLYLSLLDLCRGIGTTYAEYVSSWGVRVIDQSDIIRKYGAIINKIGDALYITDRVASEENPVKTVTLEEFNIARGLSALEV